ncbi:DUF2306 domain-containing protein [bacterium]|nr:DUF2306 domain-containing protein [bacterium]
MLGVIHTILGFVSLIAGLIVLVRPKGTQTHRILGRVYVFAMLGLNLTSFGIYRLFGGFGVFHWLAVGSLAMLAGAVATVLWRKKIKSWIYYHYYFMVWSYVGLLAGTSNEAFVHVPFLKRIASQYYAVPWCIVAVMGFAASVFTPMLANRVILSVERNS